MEPVYAWRTDRTTHRHTINVKWDVSKAREIPPQKRWAFVTVAPVPSTQYETIMGISAPSERIAGPAEPRFGEITDALKAKGQVILYGPPGTGKTYDARRFSVAWLLDENGRAGEVGVVLADRAKFEDAEKVLTTTELGRKTKAPQLTRLTFHPSYSYEDFVEGFRPVADEKQALSLRLESGVFKRVCRAALEESRRTFLVLIDEINRANVARVFGELITLLERDKRGMTVTLPQSKEAFTIPPNVYLLGTMNTADRSVKLLDVALRRRFAFIESMPNTELLSGAKVGTLALDDFLEELNRRIAAHEGREKQIGHSFLLDGEEPVSDPEEFARRFRQGILPLLQEYCYEDYATLARYLGPKLIDTAAQSINFEVVNDPDALVAALEEAFRPSGSSAE
jgi:5-methylcytosine-specific restriction enzyme B